MKRLLNLLRKLPHPSKKTVLLIIVTAAITILLSTIISIWLIRFTNFDILSLGTIKTMGVEAYWDENLTDKIDKKEKIDWGTLWLGSSNNVTIYLLSISSTETTLNLTEDLTRANLTFYNTSEDDIPPLNNISTYMNLSWNYNGSMVKPGDVIPVTLTIRANYSPIFVNYLIEKDINSFSLDIIIRTAEYAI